MDNIRSIRLRNELRRLTELSRKSRRFRIVSAYGEPPEAYLLQFDVRTLAKGMDREVHPYEGKISVQIALPSDYPRVPPIVAILTPLDLFHPNIAGPMVCLGAHTPTLWLDETCRRIWELLSYRRYTLGDGLNSEACTWARLHRELFPTDPRPFCDRKQFQIEVW
ncbi:MAG: hypothetical protein ONB15_00050 [candidate division KSB1 bacterium]|nr:hypothetical protein [candidate division KSB1 bacterium]